MIKIDDILEYVPTTHGEHGVSNVIHASSSNQTPFTESFSNPPGGAWSKTIITNMSGVPYVYDNIPRAPPADVKRPDYISQFNQNNTINLLIYEIKKSETDVEKDISKNLKNFFEGSKLKKSPPADKFEGLFCYPTNITINKQRKETYVDTTKNKKSNPYWIKKSKVQLFTGFAFAFKPEVYTKKEDFDSKLSGKNMAKMCKKHNLDVVIGVGWAGKQHIPFVSYSCSNKFKKTIFYSKFKSTFSSLEVQP